MHFVIWVCLDFKLKSDPHKQWGWPTAHMLHQAVFIIEYSKRFAIIVHKENVAVSILFYRACARGVGEGWQCRGCCGRVLSCQAQGIWSSSTKKAETKSCFWLHLAYALYLILWLVSTLPLAVHFNKMDLLLQVLHRAAQKDLKRCRHANPGPAVLL